LKKLMPSLTQFWNSVCRIVAGAVCRVSRIDEPALRHCSRVWPAEAALVDLPSFQGCD
jgi:hypothetical protein